MIDVQLPEELIQVCLALGLMRLDRPGDPDSLTLNTAFFADPAAALAGLPHDPDRRAAALGLAASLFGEVSRTLDLPDLPGGQTWVPLAQEGPAGLYAIVDAADGRVDFGIGGRAATQRDGLGIAATMAVPIARTDETAGLALLPGTPSGPVRFGIGLELPAAAPDDPVALAGIAVTADLPTAPDIPASLVVRLRGLRLPAWPEPRDITLSDDPGALGPELIELLHGLLEMRAGRTDANAGRLRALLGLLGLGDLDGIPPLPLADLFTRGPAALVDWLRSLVAVAEPWPLATWLRALADLLELELPDGVTGAGSTADPLRWTVRPVDGTEVSVQLAVVEAGGVLTIRPAVVGTLRSGTSTTLPGRLRAAVELCAVTLAATPAVTWLPRIEAGFELARDGMALVRLPSTGTADLQVGSLRAGIAAGPDHRAALTVEAVDVVLGGTPYPRLDLSSVDAVGQAASTMASDALTTALDDFFGAASGRGRALTALLGLTRPVPDGEPWPDLPPVPELIADPLGGWGRYQARVLAAGRWDRLATELARLLDATGPSGTSAGTEADPWVLRLAGATRGELQLWLWRTGSDPAPALHLAAAVVPDAVPLDGAELRLRGLLELARVDLPPTGPVAGFTERAEIRLEFGDDLVLGGPVTVRVGTAAAEVGWRRGQGWAGRLRVTGATVTAGGGTVPLPDPFELGTALPAPDSEVWTALERLFARWLADLPTGEGGALLAALLGWLPTYRLRLGGDTGPEIDLAGLAADLPPLRLADLLDDPVAALRSWLTRLLSAPTGPDLADAAAGLLTGLSGRGGAGFDPRTGGEGTWPQPWRIGLAPDPAAPAVLAWLDPDGPTLRGLDTVLDDLVPADLADALSGAGVLPGEDRLADILRTAARFDSRLDALLAGRDVARILAELRGLADGDGLVPAAAQIAAGDAQGAELTGATHLGAPAAFRVDLHAPDIDPLRAVHVTAALPGVSPWDSQADATAPVLLDLRASALPASATVGARGPWFVLLPSAADAGGAAAVADRLRAAVRAIRAAAPGPLTLIAHSVAGHTARAVWASGEAEALVTVGTPYAPVVPAGWGAEAVRLLHGLIALLPPAPDDPDVRRLAELLRTRVAVLGEALPDGSGVPVARPFPIDELTPPPLPDPPPGVAAPLAVPVRCTADDVHRAVAATVRAVGDAVRATLPEEAAGRTRAPVTHLGLGVGVDWPSAGEPGTDPGGLQARFRLRADVHRVPLRPGGIDRPMPGITLQACLGRADGWLVGAADSGPAPRLRRADLTVAIRESISVTLVLHDAGVAGIEHGRLVLGAPDAAARTLLGALGTALSPAPSGGTVRDLLDLLTAAGVAAISADGTVTFPPDALDRILVDADGYLRALLGDPAARSRLLAAAGRVLGASPGVPFRRPLGAGFTLSLEDGPDGPRLTVGTEAGGAIVGGLLRLYGEVSLGPGGPVGAALRLGGAAAAGVAGTTALVFEATSGGGPARAALEIETGRPVPVHIPIWPAVDAAGLGRSVAEAAAAELLRSLLERVRRDGPVDPLLSVLGLLSPGPPPVVRNPVWLLRDPGGWLTGPAVLGDAAGQGMLAPARLAGLVRAVGRLLGQPDDGLTLPGGGSVTVAEDGDGLVATVRLRASRADGSGADVALVVRLAPGPVVRTSVRASARRAGTAGFRSAGIDLEAGAVTTLTVRLLPEDPAGAELVLPLLPHTPGLGALAGLAGTAAVEHALPALLAALGDAGTGDPRFAAFAAALTQLGDALAIRDAATGAFRIAELRLLAGDPPAELAARYRARPAATLAALRALVAAVTGTPAGTGPLWRGPGGKIEVDVVPAGSGAPQLRVRATGLVPVSGLSAGGEATVGDAGLAEARLSIAATDADALLPGPVDLLPFAEVTLGSGVPERLEVGVWLDPPGAAVRDALLVRTTFGVGTLILHRRVTATGTTSGTDLAAAIPALVKRLAVPLAAELALAQRPLDDLLAAPFGMAARLGDVLVQAGVLTGGPGAWSLADNLLDAVVSRVLRAVAGLVQAHGGPAIGPFTLTLLTLSGDPVPPGSTRYGLGVRLSEPIEPPPIGGLVLAVEADDVWDPPLPGPPGGHVELWVAELPDDPLAAGARITATPGVRIRGLGVRVRAEQGPLLDTGLRVGSLRLHAAFAQDGAGFGHAGARLVIDGLAIDVGGAGGGNPVAGKVIAPAPGNGGDVEPVAPTFSPELQLRKVGPGPVGVTVRAGLGAGPWWIPVQRSFGPVYVAQVGLDVATAGGKPSEISLLLDGGATLAGLAVGVDDLELIVPFATAGNPLTWRIDLAGLAVSYQNGGVALAGGLRKLERDGGIEYVGMLVLRAAGFGVDVIGAWGEFPVPGTTSRYTSLFIFGALSAPLGGPPAFFVTGIGAGVGINRALVVPDDLAVLNRFPLVAAMSPGSTLAQDPMGALDEIARAFPPARGAFWLAAGVRFTTFTVVESVAILAVAIGDGVEVMILGTSRMGLPNPAAPLVMIELALKARFSSREGLLSVQAQLTTNSWLLNPSCRLTGGFAFIIWFRTGEVLLTLGGYHPRFSRPARFPVVPRLGLCWQVSSAIVVKGESYFALTPTAVMAGMRIQASFDGGFVQATFTAGVDAIVSWDPAYYDVIVFIGVTASLNIEIKLWFLGTIRIWIGFSIGAELHVWGPRLRGEAVLDLDMVRVTIPFGPHGDPVTVEPIGWGAFHDKYLVSGDPHGHTMSVAVTTGAHVPDPGGPAGPPGDGSDEHPYQVGPEFTLTTATRTAANRVNDHSFAGPPLDLTPMQIERVTSWHRVEIVDRRTRAAVGTGGPTVTPVTGPVPDGLWRLPEPGDMGADGLHPAYTGALIVSSATLTGDPQSGSINDFHIGTPRRLPLRDVRDPGQTLSAAMAAAAQWALASEGTDAFEVSVAALAGGALHAVAGAALARCLGARTERAAAVGPSPYALALLAADRVAPPRLARITTGVYAEPSAPVPVEPRLPEPDPEPPVPGAPRLAALLWPPVGTVAPPGRTTVGRWGARLPRRPAPTMRQARAGRPPLAAHLRLMPPPLGAGDRGGLAGRDVTNRFRRAGAGRERRRDLLADRGPLLNLEAGLATGVPLPAGQVQVWHVPRAGADVAAQRPELTVAGDQRVRIVVLSRTGIALADLEITQGGVPVPAGTQRLVAIGTGRVAAGTGLAGWYAGSPVLRVHPSACVPPVGLLRAAAAPALRGRTPVDTAVVSGAEAVRGAGLIRTDLPAGTRCVLLVLDAAPGAAVPAEGLLLGLDGAAQAADADGRPLPPLATVTGARVHLFFAVVPEAGATVTVTVGRDAGWTLAGVLGATRPATLVAAEVGRRGLDALVPSLTAGGPRVSTLAWRGVAP